MLDDTINDVVPETSEDLTKQAINTYRKALKSHSDEDCARAFALAQEADTGNAEVQYIIGRCYQFGDGVEEDYQVARRWFSAAAEQGHLGALYEIGRIYSWELEDPNYDNWTTSYFDELSKWTEVALKSGDQAVKEIFGSVYVFCACGHLPELYDVIKIDDATALTLTRAAADGGCAMAQYELGRRYEFGDGVSQDFVESFMWYYKAAKEKSPYYHTIADAQRQLGRIYARGRENDGIAVDTAESAKWYARAEKSYRKLAEDGNVAAQCSLGLMFYKGEGVVQDFKEAIKWFNLAAKGRSREAQYYLGNCYYQGQGVQQDSEEAVKWYRKAAELGYEDASKKLKKILANKERSGLRTECKNNNMTYADTEGVTMKKLTDKDYKLASEIAIKAIEANSLNDVVSQEDNPFLLSLYVPIANDRRKVVAAANEIFHGLGVLPAERTLKMGESDDYCYMTVVSDGDYYVLSFNHPKALSFTEDDEEYQYTIKYDHEQQEKEALAEEAEMHRLVAGIKMGRLKSKTPDGYLVLAGEFYDKIASREKAVEYRDFTEYNLKRTIGLKTIRFNRGYVKNAPQMKWSVKKVVLQDDDNNVCDPFDVPDNFWPTTIAIHLGERIK